MKIAVNLSRKAFELLERFKHGKKYAYNSKRVVRLSRFEGTVPLREFLSSRLSKRGKRFSQSNKRKVM